MSKQSTSENSKNVVAPIIIKRRNSGAGSEFLCGVGSGGSGTIPETSIVEPRSEEVPIIEEIRGSTEELEKFLKGIRYGKRHSSRSPCLEGSRKSKSRISTWGNFDTSGDSTSGSSQTSSSSSESDEPSEQGGISKILKVISDGSNGDGGGSITIPGCRRGSDDPINGSVREVTDTVLREKASECYAKIKRRLIHDVYVPSSARNCVEVIEGMLAKSGKTTIWAVSFHEGTGFTGDLYQDNQQLEYNSPGNFECAYARNHIHILHDCTWNSERCRCFGINVQRRTNIFNTSTGEQCTSSYASACLFYFEKAERNLLSAKIGSSKWGSFANSSSTIQWCSLSRDAPLSALRYKWCTIQRSGIEGAVEHQICVPGKGSQVGNSRAVPHGSATISYPIEGRRKSLPGQVHGFILNNPCFPLTAINQTKSWQQSHFKFLLQSDKVYQRGLQTVQTQMAQWTIGKFIKYYKTCNPIWGAITCSVDEYYYSVEESISKLVTLLEFQCHSSDEMDDSMGIYEFLLNLYNVCEKKVAKKNTIYIVSPPSAGKNWFLDMVQAFYINGGGFRKLKKEAEDRETQQQRSIYLSATLDLETTAYNSAMVELQKSKTLF